jgi:hypothetical protein
MAEDGRAQAATTDAGRVAEPANGDGFLAGAAELFRVAATTAARASAAPVADPFVPVAFALGWQMSELYRPERTTRQARASDEDLPGLGAIGRDNWRRLSLLQVGAGLHRLQPALDTAGLDSPDAAQFAIALDAAESPDGRRRVVWDFHVAVLSRLTAADFRLGKAYGLGRALADTCLAPTDLRSAQAELHFHRVEQLRAWLDDLGSALPPHAGHSVSASLERWTRWAGERQPGPEEDAGWAAAGMRARLRDQGRLWRALLSGEKSATGVLTPESYVLAGARLVSLVGRLMRRFLLRFWPFLLLVVLLFAGGVALVLADDDAAGRLAGASGIVASLGLSWKGVGGSLGAALARAEQPLWSAALDEKITDAITTLPGADASAFRDRLPSSNAAAPSTATAPASPT